MHSQLALLFRCVGGEARTCIALNVREYFSIGLMRFGQASGIYRDPLQQNDKPIFEWGDYYAYKMNRKSYFDRRSHSSSLLQALSIRGTAGRSFTASALLIVKHLVTGPLHQHSYNCFPSHPLSTQFRLINAVLMVEDVTWNKMMETHR